MSVFQLYYLLELHDTKTSKKQLYNIEELYYLLELHDTKTEICDRLATNGYITF